MFYYKDDEENPVKSAGIILYKNVDGNSYLLFIIKENKEKGVVYEDLGGKVENTDESILQTMAREACEESNGLLDKQSLLSRLDSLVEQNYTSFYYTKRSKYLFAVLDATDNEELLTSEDFGDKELNNPYNFKRKIDWIATKDIKNKDLFFRLRSPVFLRDLKNVKTHDKDI